MIVNVKNILLEISQNFDDENFLLPANVSVLSDLMQ